MHNPDTATIMGEWRGFYAGETVSTFFESRDAAFAGGALGLSHDPL
jgi:hypothetical protein